LFKASVAISYN